MNNTQIYIIVGIAIFLAMLSFGIAEIVIYKKSKETTSPSTSCPVFPNVTTFSLEKQILSQWHWRYDFSDDLDVNIQQSCPTTTHDSILYIDGQVSAMTDGKFFSTVSKTYIKDCHGNVIYVVRTGDLFETIINSNQILVSYELRDNNDNIIAYVAGNNFIDNNMDITDIYGNNVANLNRPLSSLYLDWTINIYNTSSPGADPRVLTLLAGKKSFSDNSKKTDICNNFFWGVAWTFLAIGIIIFIGIAFICYLSFGEIVRCCRDCYGSYLYKQNNNNHNTNV